MGGDIGAAKLGGNFHHERVNKVDAYAIFQYKTRNYGLLSKEEIVSFFYANDWFLRHLTYHGVHKHKPKPPTSLRFSENLLRIKKFLI